MKKLSIVRVNNFDTATVTMTTPAPNMGAEWMKTDIKSEASRILNTSGTITATWDDEIGVDIVALPAWNGSSSSEIRVEVFLEKTGGTALYDSGWVWAAGGPTLANWDFHQPLNVNSFAFGSTVTTVHVPNIGGKRVRISLKDPERTYLDISRVVIGSAFSPRCNPDYASSTSVNDMGKQLRAASGDVIIETGPINRKMSLNLNTIYPEDRHMFTRIMNQGVGSMVFVSVVPDASDVSLSQDWSMYGILKSAPLAFESYSSHQTSYEIEEW